MNNDQFLDRISQKAFKMYLLRNLYRNVFVGCGYFLKVQKMYREWICMQTGYYPEHTKCSPDEELLFQCFNCTEGHIVLENPAKG